MPCVDSSRLIVLKLSRDPARLYSRASGWPGWEFDAKTVSFSDKTMLLICSWQENAIFKLPPKSNFKMRLPLLSRNDNVSLSWNIQTDWATEIKRFASKTTKWKHSCSHLYPIVRSKWFNTWHRWWWRKYDKIRQVMNTSRVEWRCAVGRLDMENKQRHRMIDLWRTPLKQCSQNVWEQGRTLGLVNAWLHILQLENSRLLENWSMIDCSDQGQDTSGASNAGKCWKRSKNSRSSQDSAFEWKNK